ncbi:MULTISPECIES: SDR family NAD(P)-dependent oxidoreductase [unclassified Nocardia]|uniref:SDR family NAD(P)-dependent oxidoreductase n=1 Tax=unclassified Nocardia TaxID=2637762 RepID=UPI0033B197B1
MVWPAGETAFVTGAASGVGLGVAKALVALGARVALADDPGSSLADAAGRLAAGGGAVTAVDLDVTDPRQWAAAVDRAEAALGPISILCNAAGVSAGGPVDRTSLARWQRVHRVTIDAQFIGVSTLLPRFKRRGGRAHITTIASMAGLVPMSRVGADASAHFASVGFSMVLRDELRGTDIGVSLLCASPPTAPGDEPGEWIGARRVPVIDPDRVGELVVEAMRDRRFLIVTRREWAPLVARVHDEVERAFAFSEFDGRHGPDPAPWMLREGTYPASA